ncbi:transglycosylase domain-containing protein [Streptomyces sp. NPDC002643]
MTLGVTPAGKSGAAGGGKPGSPASGTPGRTPGTPGSPASGTPGRTPGSPGAPKSGSPAARTPSAAVPPGPRRPDDVEQTMTLGVARGGGPGSAAGRKSRKAAGAAGAAAIGAAGAAGGASKAGAAGAAGLAGAALSGAPGGGAGDGVAATSVIDVTPDGSAPGKQKKGKRPKRTGWRRIIPTWRMVLGSFIITIMLLMGAFALGYYMVHIPKANAFATKQSNVYLYADGTQIARDGEVNRENVPLSKVSKAAQHAVLAAEDRDFYTESAVDPKAMIRAAWNTATGKGKQSGSTITQQYVKNYYLAQDQTVTRKAKEFFIAIKLDREVTKDEILEGYLNTSFFGRNAYGIQAAAQAYYGVDADELTAEQGAYLAALVNAPSMYDVVAHPENKDAAVARWNYVLDGMVKEGWLQQSERAGMKFPTPKQTTTSTAFSGQRGYLVEAIKSYLVEHKIIDEKALENGGGYRITTTIQPKMQKAFIKAVDDNLMDKLDKKNRKVDNYVRAGGVSIDPKTGKVIAMYGGIDYTKQYVNNATRRDYQVGSTFKPFVFTSAVENNSNTQSGQLITPNTIYDGTSERPVVGWPGEAYAPENEDYVDYGNITVRQATDKSVNSVYAQMAVDVGPEKVEQTAIDLGLPKDTPDMNPYPSIALGTATASVLDMAEAYATLANHGEHGTYTMIEKISKDGEAIKLPSTESRQAISRQAADTTTSVLQSVVQGGTATAAQASGHPAAGKTGTAEEDQAAWFAGYTPDLATVVSVMAQNPETGAHESLYGAMGLQRINGGGAPTEIWAQFTKDALKGKKVKDFDLELQEGADVVVVPPSTPAEDPGATGEEEPTTPTDDTPTTGTTDGGTGDDTTTGGTPTTDGGATADGGTATDGGTDDSGGTATEGATADGGTATEGATADGGTATEGATADGGVTAGSGTSEGTFP